MDEVILRATEAVAGALGGLAAGTRLKSLDLGKVGDGIAGLIGGMIGTYLLSSTFPGLASVAGSGSIGGLAGMVVAAFFCGAVLLGICVLSKDLLSTKT
jgi:hypothetical protein